MILKDSMDYVHSIEHTYVTEEEITFGPMNNVKNFKKTKAQLFPMSICAIQPIDLFFWEMENRDAVKIPPVLGLIFSLLFGPFAAMVIVHTGALGYYELAYYIISRVAIGVHCLVCPFVDVLLLFHLTKRLQPLWPFIVWLSVKTLSASLLTAHIYFIYAVLDDPAMKESESNPCYNFHRYDCIDENLFHYQMSWFLPLYHTIVTVQIFFLWLVIWYALHCRREKPEPPRIKYVEEVDWYFYKPNPLYGMGFSYWDNFDTENPQGEMEEYYSDLISKGLKIQPPHQNDLYEMFNYATSSGSCPL